jgi:hypothetical protein
MHNWIPHSQREPGVRDLPHHQILGASKRSHPPMGAFLRYAPPHPLLGETDIGPAGEAVFEVPGALSVTEQNEFVHTQFVL